MAEKLKEGQIVALVFGEGHQHRKRLDLEYFKVGYEGDKPVLKFPLDKCSSQIDYIPSGYEGVQHTFPEIADSLVPQPKAEIDDPFELVFSKNGRAKSKNAEKLQPSFPELAPYLKRKAKTAKEIEIRPV